MPANAARTRGERGRDSPIALRTIASASAAMPTRSTTRVSGGIACTATPTKKNEPPHRSESARGAPSRGRSWALRSCSGFRRRGTRPLSETCPRCAPRSLQRCKRSCPTVIAAGRRGRYETPPIPGARRPDAFHKPEVCMARDVSDMTPIAARHELVAWIGEGEKPAQAWRIGTEHEKFGFYRADLRPVPYEAPAASARARGPRATASAGSRSSTTAHHRADRPIGRRRDLAGARRPVRAFRARRSRPCTDMRARPPRTSAQVQTHRRPARHRLPRPRHEPALDARRDAGDAEVALRHHDATTCRRSAAAAST